MFLEDLPRELLLSSILTIVPLSSLLALTCTSKHFASICQDPVLWKKRLQRDLNFSSTSKGVEATGFRTIYRRILCPRVFVFGSAKNGRLGLEAIPSKYRHNKGGVPFPVEATINTRVVSIVGGGWSSHALDDHGNIHVWGQLDGTSYNDSDTFSEPSMLASPAHQLDMPAKMASISCGRAHAVSLDTDHRVWIYTSWGRPCLLTHPTINSGRDSHAVAQVEAGWSFVSVLTKDGAVYGFWPFEGDFLHGTRIRNGALDRSPHGVVAAAHNTISCVPIELDIEPLLLPELPVNLPTLGDGGKPSLPRLVEIAAGDSFLLGLTDQGHVLSINLANSGRGGPTPQWLRNAFVMKTRKWVYLPHFSEINEIRKDSVFSHDAADSRTGSFAQVSAKLTVAKISAHWNTFVALAPNSGSVILGHKTTHQSNEVLEFSRTIPAPLQNRGITNVTLGDHHFGAITSEGTLLTWGSFAEGALGLGDPRRLEVGVPGGYSTKQDKHAAIHGARREDQRPPPVLLPTEVSFIGHNSGLSQPYCLAVTAGGCHTAALVIDLGEGRPSQLGGDTDVEDDDQQTGRPRQNLFVRAIASARSLICGYRDYD